MACRSASHVWVGRSETWRGMCPWSPCGALHRSRSAPLISYLLNTDVSDSLSGKDQENAASSIWCAQMNIGTLETPRATEHKCNTWHNGTIID